MTSSRIPALAGALVTCLAVSGCSFSGGAQTDRTASGPSTPRASTPSTPATTTPPSSTPSSPTTSSPPAGGQAPASPPPGTPAGTAGSDDGDPGRCATGDLAVSVGGGDGGAAGSVYTAVVLENTGSAACTLHGYPGVSYVAGSDGHQVGTAASRDGAAADARVTLAPGGVAHSTLRIVRYQAYPAQRCRPEAVDGFRVYPPGSKDAAFVRQGGATCSAQDAGVLSVQPVEPGPPTR